ncbi:MAG: pilus motility taxis protein HmpF [Leptolyngbyaceae cyanobacterium]
MLYLAEVLKKTRAFGSGKTEFRLLACQRAEYSWSAVGEEVIPAPDDVPYNSGALVLVDLSGNRSVQRYTEAGKQLVGILQNFSKLQEKFKTQEEDIEQWKQSLTYQSQELNRREMELEIRQEQVQEVESELEKLEAQRQEIETARTEADKIQEEFNRKSQELEGAWAHLNGERQKFEEQQGETSQSSGLGLEQSQQLNELLGQIASHPLPTASMSEILGQAQTLLGQQQETLDQYWTQLEEDRQTSERLQAEVEQGDGVVIWDDWHTSRDAWVKAQAVLDGQRDLVALKQGMLTLLSANAQRQEDLQQSLSQYTGAGDSESGTTVDTDALEQMPIEQLQATVQDLNTDLEKNARFVSIQEEELNAQQQDIDDLRQRIAAASEYDRLQLETELNDEQESYRMLNETLVGQRRNVQERQAVLLKHEVVLARRQGLPMPPGAEAMIDFGPLVDQFAQAKGQLAEEVQQLEAQITELEEAIAQQETQVQQQAEAVERQRQDLLQQEQEWLEKRTAAAELLGKVNTYQDTLQPIQDALRHTKDKINELQELATALQSSTDNQNNAVSAMQATLQTLTVA